jgi:hypothetical protein
MARILQTHVPSLFPFAGPVGVMLIGEAPGPRGADQSGIPFWGDRAGVLVYRALEARGLAVVPEDAYTEWDGARFRALGLAPVLQGAALGNAYPSCPTRDGQSFRAPTDKELRDPANLDRLRRDLGEAGRRCPGRLRVIAMGRRAQWILQRLEGGPPLDLHGLPHPSALGLLQAAGGMGKGMKMADLQREWSDRLNALLEV